MNPYVKAVLVLMSVFTWLTMAACNEKDLKAVEIIQQNLKEKYGEEFIVDRIGGGYGTLHTNTLKAIVYPRGAKYKKFQVEITKDLKTFWDSYMNMLLADQLDSEVAKQADQYINSSYRVKTFLSSDGMTYPNQALNRKHIPLKEYLAGDTSAIIYLFINSASSALNFPEEAEKLHSFALELPNLGVKRAYLRVFYVKPNIFESIDSQQEIVFDNEKAYNYFSHKEHSYFHSWLRIDDFVILESVKNIESNFK